MRWDAASGWPDFSTAAVDSSTHAGAPHQADAAGSEATQGPAACAQRHPEAQQLHPGATCTTRGPGLLANAPTCSLVGKAQALSPPSSVRLGPSHH